LGSNNGNYSVIAALATTCRAFTARRSTVYWWQPASCLE
jgi:hypothetical protein